MEEKKIKSCPNCMEEGEVTLEKVEDEIPCEYCGVKHNRHELRQGLCSACYRLLNPRAGCCDPDVQFRQFRRE